MLTTGKAPGVRSVVVVGLLLHALSGQLAAQLITELPTPTPTDTPPPTPTVTPLPTHGTQGQCQLMSCSSTSLASCVPHTGPICNTDADCPGSQLLDPLTYQPMYDQNGKSVLTNKGTCPSWKCRVCRASPSAGVICRLGPACGSDAACPASQVFDANGFPVFDANGNPVLTKAGTCPSGFCVSDCNNDARVTVDEILSLVNVALGNTDVSTCLFGDLNHDGQITVDEILTAVNTALNGCPPPPATPTPGQPRFVDNGDGTITDVQTGLMWEKKSDDSGIHDKDDTYTWSTCSDPSCSPDGTAFSVFLKALNDSNLAGYHDWRLPTFGELNSIFDSDAWAYGSGAPYVPPVFNTNCGANSDGNVGCTVDGAVSTPACSCTATTYWSLSTEEVYLANGPVTFPLAFDFYHGTGVFLSLSNKNATSSVRAVRGVPPGTGIPGL